jgi:hypothetical protein
MSCLEFLLFYSLWSYDVVKLNNFDIFNFWVESPRSGTPAVHLGTLPNKWAPDEHVRQLDQWRTATTGVQFRGPETFQARKMEPDTYQ